MFGRHRRLEARLRESGRSATARVLECRAGMTITEGNPALVANTQVVCKLRLSVEPPGEPVFEARTSARFSQFGVPGEGDTVHVLFDPEDHGRVVVVEPTAGEALGDVLTGQIERFRGMGNAFGTTLADQLEAARAAGRLDVSGSGREAVAAYNEAFSAIVGEAKESLGMDSAGPVVIVGGEVVPPGAAAVAQGGELRQFVGHVELRRGVLTEDEFAAQKAKLLAR